MEDNKNLNILDKLISWIDPRLGAMRQQWRMSMSNYDVADSGRRNTGWTAVNQPAEQTNQASRDMSRARARDLERNSDIAEAIINNLERNVVGNGIKLQARIINKQGQEDELLNTTVEELWKDWGRARNCDITGQQSFAELQALAIRRIVVDGGILFIKVYDSQGRFKLQAREVDDIDNTIYSVNEIGNNRIINGIEVDKYNKPVAYYLKTITPNGLWTGENERIEANRVIYLFKKKRVSQIREISELSRTASRIRDINEFVEAISVKERILACLAIFIKKMSPGFLGRGSTQDTKSGYYQKTLSPGMIQELQTGEDVSVVNPNGQSANAKEFICTQQRLAGSGQGLSYEAVARDMSQVNYSSARQGMLEDQRTYSMWQNYLIEHLCYEVYTEFIINQVLLGALKIPDFWQRKKDYIRHEWITPGWSWIDPLKEVKANQTALETGQTTLADITASQGKDWRDVLKQRAKEKELEKELGLITIEVNNNATNTTNTTDTSK